MELFPQTSGEFTPPRKPEEKDSNMRGSFGSQTTLTHGTSPNCGNTPKIPPSRQADQDSREDLSPDSIPLSQNYFDALSKEQDVHSEGLGKQKPPRAQKALAPCQRQREKAPMSIQAQEAEWEEKEFQRAWLLSKEAHSQRGANKHWACKREHHWNSGARQLGELRLMYLGGRPGCKNNPYVRLSGPHSRLGAQQLYRHTWRRY